ncbi:type II toxin-antitoxin system RelB/DinJ family antitoxin [Weissella diestrammenae]|uniref:Type II toxin-antitoxin system RelB/DinJ family antitoxin n=2 Tax=Weissella diestrammenae TaxID=1162633 RepID=A0A7G9T7R5_9LACO|nr:type II toxin-antitoxin system RelB/DinJ family antitoxin [Weissella diestrammenae]QNN76140.1 type II toxin-antitoxin system RelB/DinJ family antitoxin [Weissella diestrammenae]
MDQKLIQFRMDSDVAEKANDILKTQGLNVQLATKIFLTDIANTGNSPFSHLFDAK